ncbi:MAG: crossover junction endodeoxyribonuclease RuvC [Candidatus Paceibacterota bacterium]|jgi:crossover junction endodeoxyribonuclease RuvC
MKVIAIDPGYERMGVAVIEKTSNKEVLVFSECFKTSAMIPHEERLKLIGQKIESLIKKHKPDAMAIETLFFKNNQKTAMHVSEARGVMLYVASVAEVEVKEFSPMAIKIAVTGYGSSEKGQVTAMVQKLIKINTDIKYDDEYDAIAVGLTFFACIKQFCEK